MGVTFCAVAPEHPLALHAAATSPKLAAFIEECKKGGTTEAELAVKEKEGLPTGLFVTHPLTGAQVEVWVGNYRSEEHTSELQSPCNLVCRLLLEKKTTRRRWSTVSHPSP